MNSEKTRNRRRIVVRSSGIHGKGVFVNTFIPAGSRLIEYKGERISDEECYVDDDASAHTFLYMMDNDEIIDGGRNGNAARWINHSCDPNCEAVEEDGRVFMDTVRPIESGDEVTIDYNLYLEVRYTAALKREYACGCGTMQCRGTMLASKR